MNFFISIGNNEVRPPQRDLLLDPYPSCLHVRDHLEIQLLNEFNSANVHNDLVLETLWIMLLSGF